MVWEIHSEPNWLHHFAPLTDMIKAASTTDGQMNGGRMYGPQMTGRQIYSQHILQ